MYECLKLFKCYKIPKPKEIINFVNFCIKFDSVFSVGEQNGYNIPEVVPFADLRWWLSEEGMNFLLSAKDDKVLPEITRRLLCDAYMCMYQSPDVMMYR